MIKLIPELSLSSLPLRPSLSLSLSPSPFILYGVLSSGRSCLFPFEDGFLDDSHGDPSLTPGLNSPTRCQNGERMERYSRKVFVGGLPPDIDEGELPACCSFALMLMHTLRCISNWMSPRACFAFVLLLWLFAIGSNLEIYSPCLEDI